MDICRDERAIFRGEMKGCLQGDGIDQVGVYLTGNRKAWGAQRPWKEYSFNREDYSNAVFPYRNAVKEYSNTVFLYSIALKEYSLAVKEYSFSVFPYPNAVFPYRNVEKEYAYVLL